MVVRTAHLIALSLVILTACARGGAHADLPVPQPLFAAVTFNRFQNDEVEYAVMRGTRTSWAAAATIPLPGSSYGMSLEGAPSEAERPIVMVAHASPTGDSGFVRVSLNRVNVVSRAGGVLVRPAAFTPCLGKSWLAAFFIDGLGPRPAGPVTLRLRVGDSVSHMLIDPRRHTVRAEPALTLLRGMSGLRIPDWPTAHVQPAAKLRPVLPLIAWRTDHEWGGFGHTGDFLNAFEVPSLKPVDHGFRIAGRGPLVVPPIVEWRFYFLERPPRCT